jgi:uncharacterized phiE125 gp8 family phage protein
VTEIGALVLVTGTTFEPVTRSETKLWLKVDEDETADDALIDALLTTARQRWEQRAERSCLKQTFDYVLDEEPCENEILLPRSPLVSVTSVKGYANTDLTDTGGVTMNSSGYYVDTAHEPGRVVLLGSASWPSATRNANAFIVRFTAGYSSQSSGVPEQAKTEIKQLVAALYEHRGDQAAMQEILTEFDKRPSDLELPEWG